MKLISCYIEGYGAIEKKEYFFNEGITAFCQENGTGKTTLASFIKAMFYGLKGYKEGSTEFCDREHFYPFKGGRFGGNLTFSKDGKTYKIERYFGEKTTRGDTLKVYRGGELTDELGDDLGKAVFGVDEASFLRTLFIGSDEIEIKSTSSINAKLGGFLQGMDEEEGYDNALKKLDDARKNYQAYRRSRNPVELIPCLEREIEGLKNEIDNAKTIQGSLEYKYTRAEALKGEIDALNRQIVIAQEENERRKAYEHYDSLTQSIADKEKRVGEILYRYPMGVPSEEETLAINGAMMKEKEITAAANSVEFSIKDGEKLARLEESFARGIPTEGDFWAVSRDVDKRAALETELRLIAAKEPTAREKALSQKFLHEYPSEAQISEIGAQVEAYKQAKREYDSMPSEMVYAPTSSPAAQNSSRLFTLLAVFATLLCAVGAMCLLTEKTTLGIALLAVGGVLLIVSGLTALKGKPSSAQAGTMYALNDEKQRKERELREIEYSIKAKLTRYGYHSDNGVAYDFAEMQKDVLEYAQYTAFERERKGQLAEKQAQKQEIEGRLTAFFLGYGLSGGDYSRMLADLRGMVSEYYSLKERKNSYTERKTSLQKELEETRVKIEAYKRKYGLTELRINDVLEDIRTYHRLCTELEKERVQAAAYKQKEGLAERSVEERIDIGELQTMLTEKQNERSKLEREIEADETAAESVYEKEAKLAEAEEKLQEYRQKHRLLKAAKEFLESADGKLKDKYVKPIKDEFLRYAVLLEKTLGERVVMTKNFEIRFERDGAERSEKHLSAGQRSICTLCFRLALIKNMYKDSQPFLILDDPFVALDDRHMDKVRMLLTELSKDVQMVYFTCHESRMV